MKQRYIIIIFRYLCLQVLLYFVIINVLQVLTLVLCEKKIDDDVSYTFHARQEIYVRDLIYISR